MVQEILYYGRNAHEVYSLITGMEMKPLIFDDEQEKHITIRIPHGEEFKQIVIRSGQSVKKDDNRKITVTG